MDGSLPLQWQVDRAPAEECPEPAPPESPLWGEHGWALGGRHVAVIIGVIVVLSLILR